MSHTETQRGGGESKNLFCNRTDLTNESDVEQFFVIRLLNYLGFKDENIKTKNSIDELVVSKGSRKENYKPDYVCFAEKRPKIVVDAKHPDENIDDYTYQVSGYALALNKKFKNDNPVRFTILTNGIDFKLYKWDEEEPILILKFKDFEKDNNKFEKLVNQLSFESILKQTGKDEISIEDFLTKPSVEEIKSAFNRCHRIIWRKEKISPTDAFYEFSKIIFIKMDEDKKIRKLIKEGKELKRNDFKFSIDWLNDRETETENPLSTILFRELCIKLQEQIEKNKKKPIFAQGEEIELKEPTIREVVKLLQNYDLYTIDEDLNGRMFEEFLNATIRGRELGQYFTPRKIVKFMTKLANPKIRRVEGDVKIELILDACCGSGGFLIDAMADLIEKIKGNPSLRPEEDDLLEKIKLDSIFGIEANPKISKVARMNMYAHGDGGSRIYCADSLDKKILITKGTNKEIKKEMEELRDLLINKEMKFDIVLTNPPFSMSYVSKDKDEKVVLEEYGSDDPDRNISYETGTKKLKASVKSNVLFLARYLDLLNEKGRLFIILDNSVLNSYSHEEYRNFIRSNFIIKGIFQLPTETFVNQEAGGITSILYLQKKNGKEQASVFARVVNNVGHSTSGKEQASDDFDDILKEYKKYEEEGKLYLKGEKLIGNYENDDLFLIEPDKISDRLDVFFHQPSYHKLLKKLEKAERDGKCDLKRLSDFDRVKDIQEIEKEESERGIVRDTSKIYKYIEISAIDKERGFIINGEWEEGTREQLPDRAKLLLKENDILFSMPFRSLQKVVIVPAELDGQLGSNGFYGIRPKNYSEACLLWSIFRSDLIQKQFIHLSSGYTQRGMSSEHLVNLVIPIPKDVSALKEVVVENIKKAKKARTEEIDAINQILNQPLEMIKP